ARLPDPALYVLRQVPQVELAGDQLAPGVADADDRATVEDVVRQARPLDPAPVDEPVAVELSVALPAPKRPSAHVNPRKDGGRPGRLTRERPRGSANPPGPPHPAKLGSDRPATPGRNANRPPARGWRARASADSPSLALVTKSV